MNFLLRALATVLAFESVVGVVPRVRGGRVDESFAEGGEGLVASSSARPLPRTTTTGPLAPSADSAFVPFQSDVASASGISMWREGPPSIFTDLEVLGNSSPSPVPVEVGELPVVASSPSPSPASVYYTGVPAIIGWSITNNVPESGMPCMLTGLLPSLMNRVTVANDCGTTLPRGPASCQVALQILANASNSNPYATFLQLVYGGRYPVDLASFNFTVVKSSPTATASLTATATATGTPSSTASASATGTGTSSGTASASATGTGTTTAIIPSPLPLGVVMGTSCVNGGNCVWGIAPTFQGGSFSVVVSLDSNVGPYVDYPTPWTLSIVGTTQNPLSCAGAGSYCVTGGRATEVPLLVSPNGGKTWTAPSLPFAPDDFLWAFNCVPNPDGSVFGIAGGQDVNNNPLYVYTPTGADWVVGSSSLPPGGAVYSVNCASSATVVLCMGVGGSNSPFAFYSINGGGTWTQCPLELPGGYFNDVSATSNSTTILAMLVGVNTDSGVPLVVTASYDASGDVTWTLVNYSGLTAFTDLNYVCCIMFNGTTSCVVTDGYSNNFAVSTDGGKTWTTVAAPVSGGVYVHATSCTVDGSGNFGHQAVGEITSSGAPLMLVSISPNGGLAYLNPSFNPSLPTQAQLVSMSCALGNCIAGGVNTGNNQVVLVAGSDGVFNNIQTVGNGNSFHHNYRRDEEYKRGKGGRNSLVFSPRSTRVPTLLTPQNGTFEPQKAR